MPGIVWAGGLSWAGTPGTKPDGTLIGLITDKLFAARFIGQPIGCTLFRWGFGGFVFVFPDYIYHFKDPYFTLGRDL